eukprot:GHVU01120461.1.p1 GENE.GHVU01120461.1~~GHVU01120461.1.p1  ORF type:complete len:524 (+),score=27.86 GHVU01120461.1:192-1574(+)
MTAPLLGGQSSDDDIVETRRLTEIQDEQEVPKPLPVGEEASWQIALQVFFPYMVAGLGMVAAGMVLDIVQHWDVFEDVSEVFILVPALLGLKGNLEMTLASRLSTQSNIGNMDSPKEQWKMIGGNIALTQAQAIVVGFLASVAAMVFGWIPQGKFNLHHGLLLAASSMATAAVASFILGSVMVAVILLSRRCRINPDNVATPIAASLGDLITLTLLSGFASLLYKSIDTQPWIAPVIIIMLIAVTPLWCIISHRNSYTQEVLYEGWTPVIGAMVISSIGGLILDFAVSRFKGIAVFQPVINGVGGNLVAVQASRLSTALHSISTPGVLPESGVHGCPNCFSTYFSTGVHARTSRVLMLLVVPGHLIFIYTISYLRAGHTSITSLFAVTYLSAAVIQVALLLYIASWLVHLLWVQGNDPDNFAIPYLTALGDLLGTGLLAATFCILAAAGESVISNDSSGT